MDKQLSLLNFSLSIGNNLHFAKNKIVVSYVLKALVKFQSKQRLDNFHDDRQYQYFSSHDKHPTKVITLLLLPTNINIKLKVKLSWKLEWN